MAWIERRGRRYLVVWREGGKRRAESVPSYAHAEARKAELEHGAVPSPRIPFRDYLEPGPHLKASTRYQYQHLLKTWVLPHVQEMPAHAVGSTLRGILMQLRGHPALERKVRAVLLGGVRRALADGALARNPLEGYRPPRRPRRALRPLTREEVARIHAAMRPRYRAAVSLAAYGGLRLGEIAALRVEDVDGRVVRISRAVMLVGGRPVPGEPKTRSSRRAVTLPAPVAEELAEHARRYAHDGWLFRTTRGGWLSSAIMSPIWREALRRAGIPEPYPRFHDLRHTHASWLIAAGAHPKEIADRLGHASIAITMDVYGHLFPAADERLADLLA